MPPAFRTQSGIVMKTYKTNGLRVLVLHNTLSPYRIPLFQALSKSSGYHFDFFFSSRNIDVHRWEFEEDLGFHYGILPVKTIRTKYGTLYFLTDIRMITCQCDLIVLSDHLNIPELTLQIYAKFKKIPVLRWLAMTKNSLEGMSMIKIKLKAWLNQISEGILVPGNEGREYVFETTKREDNIYICNNSVHNELFSKARAIPHETVLGLKQKFGLKGFVISFFGQFVERKGIDVLLKAINLVNPQYEFSLLFVGDGPLKAELLRKKDENGKYPIAFAGYINPSELPVYYALSDITVLPSYVDTWGMVVNESMAAGVPVICSTGAGAARDLIRPGKSGLLFEKGDAQGLASAIEAMLSSDQLRQNMVKEADKILENYTVEKARDQFLDAIDKTYAHSKILNK